jgi:uncharacterized protein YeaO (DUF488 family)
VPKSRHRPVKLKRVYSPPAKSDGKRVLVDGLWPRGLRKEQAHLTCWLKELAPSRELRRWFGHDPARWEGFRKRYMAELEHKPEPLQQLRSLSEKGTVTLLFAARDETHNNAVVLREVLGK